MEQSEAMEQIRRDVRNLETRISSGEFGTAQFWGGADVVISDIPPEPRETGFFPEPRRLVTKSAAELSWLFKELMTAFGPVYDAGMKYEFFGRLSNAAERHETQSEDPAETRELLLAVIREAMTIADELDAGRFMTMPITFDNQIADDFRGREDAE